MTRSPHQQEKHGDESRTANFLSLGVLDWLLVDEQARASADQCDAPVMEHNAIAVGNIVSSSWRAEKLHRVLRRVFGVLLESGEPSNVARTRKRRI